MLVYPLEGILPRLGERAFVAPGSVLCGDVVVGDDVSFWYHTVARGDVNWIRVGARTNIQDNAVLHVNHDTYPLSIGKDVTVGHSAVVHGCTVEDGCLLGIGAKVLDGAVLETGCQVAAGAVVTPGTRVPAGHLAVGIPARVARPLSDGEKDEIRRIVASYVELKEKHRAALGSAGEASGETR